MTGERLAWHRVASHLHTTVGELANRITFTEFLDWLDFLDWAEGRTVLDHHYLAQIAREVRRSYVKTPNSVKIDEFMIKVVSKEAAARAAKSKDTWLRVLDIKLPSN